MAEADGHRGVDEQAAFFGIVAVPVGLLMIGGEFDLSTGVMTGVTAIVMALLVGKWHVNTWIAILITLAFASRDRAAQRLHRRADEAAELHRHAGDVLRLCAARAPAACCCSTAGARRSRSPQPHPAGLSSAKSIFGSSFFSSGSLPSGYSTAILWFIGVTIVGTWVLSRTTFGNWIFASGGDQNAARNTGVPVRRTKVLLFVGTALAAALVGIISFTQASSAVSEQGVGYEFFYIIAAVVGGCLLTGGYGSAIGAALGACIIGMAFEGVIYAGWDSSWDFAFLGVILFLAVVVNTLIYRRALKARR